MADTSFNGEWVTWDLEECLKFPRSIGGVAYLKLLRIGYGVRYLNFPIYVKEYNVVLSKYMYDQSLSYCSYSSGD